MSKVSIIMPALIRNADEVKWMGEAIQSVLAQTFQDWELIIVNDDSQEWPDIPEDTRIKVHNFMVSEGVSSARNMAARMATSDLILPLDADDRLAPFALEKFLDAWKGEGFIYSSVMMFGLDWTRQYPAQRYSFSKLLKTPGFCIVGCLHKKADWERIGGWKPSLDIGLEDWEYWIAAGELGICGTPIRDVCYWYRRTANGRLSHLIDDHSNYQAAYDRLRELHKDSYNGRYTEMCCGGKSIVVPPDNRRTISNDYEAPINTTLIQYTGRRGGSFGVRGNVSSIRYTVPGMNQLVIQPDGTPGIDSRDVPWFLTLGRGVDFKVYMPPVIPAAPPAPVQVQPVEKESVEEVKDATVERSAPVPAPDRGGDSDVEIVKPVRPRRRPIRHVPKVA
jgi:glycosyltransferase involved in cell wall biosynthesis